MKKIVSDGEGDKDQSLRTSSEYMRELDDARQKSVRELGTVFSFTSS